MTLTQNKKYRATITLNFLESLATNEFIAQLLTKEGLTNVQVTGKGMQRTAIATATKSGPVPDAAKKYLKEIVEI